MERRKESLIRSKHENNRNSAKMCNGCQIVKHSDDFGVRTSDGSLVLRSRCKSCEQYEVAKYRKLKPETLKISNNKGRFSRYGITEAQYMELLSSQGGMCAICKRTDSGNKSRSSLFIDHCHDTYTIRGLLCTNCNVAIGMLKGNIDIINNAAKYLRNHKRKLGHVGGNH